MILVILFLGWAIYYQYNVRLDRSANSKPVGHVTYKNHVVERRYGDRFVWEEVDSRSNVYLYDSILSRDQSDAVVTLKNGTRFEIEENTMIQIDEEGIVLASGSIKAKNTKGKGLIKTKDGTIIDISKGDVRLDQSENGLNITVKEGQVALKKNGKEETVKTGENVNISTEGKLQKSKIQIQLTSPTDSATLLTAAAARQVTLSWQSPPTSGYIVQVAPDSAFGAGRRTYRTRANSITVNMAVGTHNWRVTSQDRKMVSAISTVRLRKESQITVFSPGNNSTITTTSKKKHNVTFKWHQEDEAPVKIEVSKSRDMKNPVVSKVVSNKTTRVTNLDTDKYYWRITHQHKKNRSEAKVYSFNIQEGDKDRVEKGRLEKEREARRERELQKKKQLEEQQRREAAFKVTARPTNLAPRGRVTNMVGQRSTLNLRWQPVRSANQYLVQVYQRRGRALVMLKQVTTRNNRARLRVAPRDFSTRVYWRVRGQRLVNRRLTSQGPFAETRLVFRASLKPPQITKVIVKPK